MYSVLRLTVLFTLFVSLFTPVPGSGSIQCGDNIEINNLFSSASYGYFTVSRRAIIFFASFATTTKKTKQKQTEQNQAKNKAKAKNNKLNKTSDLHFYLL